jgi:hypothetical protein
VDDLLAHAANDPDSDIETEEAGRTGSPLSAGSALAPANTVHRNTLLSIFYDAAQASQERSTDDVARLPNHPSPDSLQSPTPPTSAFTTPMGSSSSLTTQKENQPSVHEESTRRVQGNPTSPQTLRPLGATSGAPLDERNSNGKRPQQPHCPFPALAKKPRGGATGRGASSGNTSSRVGSRTK